MPGQESFIKVIDNVLSDELCSQFIHQFESSQNKSTGLTGGGVDTDKKRRLTQKRRVLCECTIICGDWYHKGDS
jgi:hypothetical protein